MNTTVLMDHVLPAPSRSVAATESRSPALSATPASELVISQTRVLWWLNGYRLFSALLLIAIVWLNWQQHFALYNRDMFYALSPLYLVFAIGCLWLVKHSAHNLTIILFALLLVDLLFITLFLYASGGAASGLGMLIFPWLVGNSWLMRNRIALLHAAMATVALLALETYWWLSYSFDVAKFLPTGLLGIGYFITAGVGQLLGRYAKVSEELAEQRGIDLANLSVVNQLIIQDMQDGVLVIDGNGIVRSYNKQALRLMGQYAEKAVGIPLMEFAPLLLSYWEAWLRYDPIDNTPLSIPGLNRLLRLRFVPVGMRRQSGALLYLEDLGRAQTQAHQIKLAALGRLTANIAHEVRNPLSAVNHATELLQEEKGLPESARRLLSIIHNNSKRIDRIVDDVLQLNRRDRQQAEVFALGPYIENLINEIIEVEKIPLQSVVTTVAHDVAIRFDRGHLNQILWNLIRNAWQYCRKQANSIQIQVRPGYQPNKVLCEIRDDGPGVPVDSRAKLFEPFFTTRAGGTGLGLYVARQLCEANGAILELVETTPSGHFRIIAERGTL